MERANGDRHGVRSYEQLELCAHDLRGILTVIAGYASLLHRADLPEQHRTEALEGIDAAVHRADGLLADALTGSSAPRTTGEPADLAAIVRQAAADARVATGRDVIATLTDEPVVPGDEIAISRALENLLTNAAKYAPTGPIEITLAVDRDRARIEVSDRGPGIPVDMRDAMLEPFARLPRDDEKPGTGLGLTVVRSVAERHFGSVMIADRAGGGTTVRLELPVG